MNLTMHEVQQLVHIVGMSAESLLMDGKLNPEQVTLVWKVNEAQACRMQNGQFVIITPGITIVS